MEKIKSNTVFGGVLLSDKPSKFLAREVAEWARISNIVRARELFLGWLLVGVGFTVGFLVGVITQSAEIAFVVSFFISMFGAARIAAAPSYYTV